MTVHTKLVFQGVAVNRESMNNAINRPTTGRCADFQLNLIKPLCDEIELCGCG